MRYGKNKGCDFLNKKCINSWKKNSKFGNEFFNYIKNKVNNYDSACSSGRQSRGYNYFYSMGTIPKEYDYFNKTFYGGRPVADYCPVRINDFTYSTK